MGRVTLEWAISLLQHVFLNGFGSSSTNTADSSSVPLVRRCSQSMTVFISLAAFLNEISLANLKDCHLLEIAKEISDNSGFIY